MKKTGLEIMLLLFIGSFFICPTLVHADANTYLYRADLSNITIDGQLGQNEYPFSFDLLSSGGSKFGEMAWAHNTTDLAVYIQVSGTGWVGLGIGDKVITMGSADVVMSTVDSSNNTIVRDMYIDTSGAEPLPTLDANSYIDNSAIAGTETDSGSTGQTTVEFIIPLASNDTAGRDHNWSEDNVYGFFVAYNKNSDDITQYHTAHTHEMTVEVLSVPFTGAFELDLNLAVDYAKSTNTVTLTTTVYKQGTTEPVANLTIKFYQVTQFGGAEGVYLGNSTTDNNGIASLTITTDSSGNTTYSATYAGTYNIVATQEKQSVDITGGTAAATTSTFGDIRDFFHNEHLIRSFMLFMFYLVVVVVLYNYAAVIRDVVLIGRDSKSKQTKEEQK